MPPSPATSGSRWGAAAFACVVSSSFMLTGRGSWSLRKQSYTTQRCICLGRCFTLKASFNKTLLRICYLGSLVLTTMKRMNRQNLSFCEERDFSTKKCKPELGRWLTRPLGEVGRGSRKEGRGTQKGKSEQPCEEAGTS